MDHPSSLSNAGSDLTAGNAYASTAGKGGVIDDTLSGGTDDYAVSQGELASAYDAFADAETVDVNLLMGGTTPAGWPELLMQLNSSTLPSKKRCGCIYFTS